MIDRWVLIVPQIKGTVGSWPSPVGDVAIAQRTKTTTGTRFKAFTEPRHRRVAEYIAGVRLAPDANGSTKALRAPRPE